MPTHCGFDHIDDKDTLYRGKNCMKKFSNSLRKHAKNIIDFEKKQMLPSRKEELKSYWDAPKLIKMVTKVLTLYPTKESLLIVWDLWQHHYQILLIITRK